MDPKDVQLGPHIITSECYYQQTMSIDYYSLQTPNLGATYFPCAVSPESMIASVPSLTAIAISETSARVGVGWLIILSSILVATITGFPMLRQPLMIWPCTRPFKMRAPLCTLRWYHSEHTGHFRNPSYAQIQYEPNVAKT